MAASWWVGLSREQLQAEVTTRQFGSVRFWADGPRIGPHQYKFEQGKHQPVVVFAATVLTNETPAERQADATLAPLDQDEVAEVLHLGPRTRLGRRIGPDMPLEEMMR